MIQASVKLCGIGSGFRDFKAADGFVSIAVARTSRLLLTLFFGIFVPGQCKKHRSPFSSTFLPEMSGTF